MHEAFVNIGWASVFMVISGAVGMVLVLAGDAGDPEAA